ncbi:HAMP domain-containing protein [Marinicella meishanensis]|uniref:HAMP domain-containing protein n=1 Tax=Marinicella meishanensis TaxID=2873263 RepID=UPI001CC05708|nr:HAMP domain-containing protein [Marinicella sp. NBU2979]
MTFGLKQKLLSAVTLALVVISLILWFSNQNIAQLSADINLSKDLSKLEQLIDLMQEQSTQYDQNAPRDYESYNRDLKVFYTQLQENLASMRQMINQSAHHYYNRNSTTNVLLDSMLLEQNNQAFQQMEQALGTFTQGFAEQIGDDPEEPRLEWGNDYILADTAGLFGQIETTHRVFEDLVQAQQKATVRFNWLAVGLVALLLLLLYVWFNQSIVKRIIRVAKACREVSLGNYGLKIKDASEDEIGQLVADFNQLSGRSQSILSLLKQLHAAPSQQHAMEVIKTETQAIVNVSNAYFLTPKKDSYAVQLIASNQAQKGLLGKTLVPIDSTIDGIEQQDHIHIEDVLAHTIANQQAHFAKYLLNQVNANAILVIKIKQQHQTGLLLFTKKSKRGFDESHIQTLLSLGPLFANALL